MPDWITARVTHRFEHTSAEEVYDAWLNEEDVRVWLADALSKFGLEADVKRIEIEPRVGGRFFFSDLRDGVEAEHWGTYRALERPRRIEFIWFTSKEEEEADASIVRIEILAETSGCTVTLTHSMDADYAAYREQTEKAWSTMLGAIGALCDREVRGQSHLS